MFGSSYTACETCHLLKQMKPLAKEDVSYQFMQAYRMNDTKFNHPSSLIILNIMSILYILITPSFFAAKLLKSLF